MRRCPFVSSMVPAGVQAARGPAPDKASVPLCPLERPWGEATWPRFGVARCWARLGSAV